MASSRLFSAGETGSVSASNRAIRLSAPSACSAALSTMDSALASYCALSMAAVPDRLLANTITGVTINSR